MAVEVEVADCSILAALLGDGSKLRSSNEEASVRSIDGDHYEGARSCVYLGVTLMAPDYVTVI